MKVTIMPTGLPRRALLISSGILGLSAVYFMIVPLLSLYMSIRLHSSALRIGVVLAVMTVANQGLQVFVGILADRFTIKTMLSAGIFVACLGCLGFSVHPSFYLQICSALTLGVGAAAVSVLGKAMLADAAGEKKASAFALRAAAVNGGGAVGPVLGALVFGWFQEMLLITGAVYAIFWLLLVRPMPRPETKTGHPGSIGGQVRALLGIRRLLILSGVSIGFWYLYTQLTLTFALYANDRFRLGGKVGLFFAAEAVIAVLLQYPVISWLQHRVENWRILGVGCLILTAAFLFLGSVPTVWALLLFIVAFAFGSLLIVPTLDVIAVELSPPTMVAGALGTASLGWAIGGLLGDIGGGALYGIARQSGHFELFWDFNSVVAIVTAVAFFALAGRRVHRLPAPGLTQIPRG
jgi:MFS transporter, DHA1 family, multidrug resistance protein